MKEEARRLPPSLPRSAPRRNRWPRAVSLTRLPQRMLKSSPRFGIPAANHTPPVFRIRSTGLGQSVGTGSQRIVDTKIAVRFERNAIGSVVLDERSGGFTNQRGEDALIGVLPDAVAAGQEQTAPLTLICPTLSTSARSSAILQGPAPGLTPLTTFSLDVRERAIRVRRSSAVLHRNHANAAFESRDEVALACALT